MQLALTLAFEGELVVRLPGLDGVALVTGGGPDAIEGYTLVSARVRLGERWEVSLGNLTFAVRFDRELLMPAPDDAGVVASHAQIYVTGSVSIDDNFDVRVQGFDAIQRSPVMIGSSGIVLSASDVKLDLSRTTAIPEVLAAGFGEDFLGVFIGEAKVRFPDGFPALAPEDLVLSNAAIGSGGVSGALSASYAPTYDEPDRRFVMEREARGVGMDHSSRREAPVSARIGVGVILLAVLSCTGRSPERATRRGSGDVRAAVIDEPSDAPPAVAAAGVRCGEAPGPSLADDDGVRTAVVLDDGRLLVSGKVADGPIWTAVIEPSTGARFAADIPGEVSVDVFLRLSDGRVLALGHAPPLFRRPFTLAARFDPATGEWTVLAAPPACLTADSPDLRSDHRVTVGLTELADGRVLAVGHRCAAYLASSTWLSAPVPPSQRRGFTLTRLGDGDVLRVGGLVTMAGDKGPEPSASVERFDVERGRWRRVASMHYTRHAHTSTLRRDGTVVVIGGCELSGAVCNGEGPAPPVEFYDPATDRWMIMGTAPITDRWAHTATSVGDRIIVLGGEAHPEYSPRPTAVLDGHRWLEAPAPAWRSAHTAVLVGDRILLAGPLNHEFSPPLAWYGVAEDCPTTDVRLGPAPPPQGPTP